MGFLKINEFTQKLYQYVDARLELAKVEMQDRLGRATALIVQLTLLVVLLGSMLLFLNIALALYINTFSFCKDAPYLGFLIVAGIHFSLMVLIVLGTGKFLSGIRYGLQASFQRFMKYVSKGL